MERTAAGRAGRDRLRVIALTHLLAALAERRSSPLESFMIGPCMPHQRLEAVPAVAAAIVHLPDYQERRVAGDIMADCPGWHVWYSDRIAQWIAHRCGGPGCDDGTDPTLVLIAADPGELRAGIGQRALSDLATDLPGWEVTCTDDGFWWASETGLDDGCRRRGIICATSPVKLAIAVRTYTDLMARQPDLRPVSGDGPHC